MTSTPTTEASPSRLVELLEHQPSLPDGHVMYLQVRHDPVTKHTYHSVFVHAATITPETFTFGMPGGYSCITLNDNGTYAVRVHETSAAYTYQHAGQCVEFDSAATAVRTAVWLSTRNP